MAEQIAFISHAPLASTATGYVCRAGRPRVKGSRTTSVNLSAGERDLLERLAASESATLNDVWRRALHLYAAHNGLTEAAPDTEVSAAA